MLRPIFSLSLSFFLVQAPQTSTPQGTSSTFLQSSINALAGSATVVDVTLSGTARRIAGSDDEIGSVTLRALSSGATRLDFDFPSGPRTELKTFVSNVPAGSWSGPDGVAHPIANHNLVNDWGWFPLFTCLALAHTKTSVVSLIGSDTRNGESVVHLSASQQFPTLAGNGGSLMQHLSQIEIFLDATALLPASIAYNIHPDDNALIDIPVELQFSDYRNVSGSQFSFHVQKFINNSLVLDLQFQDAALNTGATVAQIGAQ